jgi:hypothetical protein
MRQANRATTTHLLRGFVVLAGALFFLPHNSAAQSPQTLNLPLTAWNAPRWQ